MTIVYTSFNSTSFSMIGHRQVDQGCKSMYTVTWKLRSQRVQFFCGKWK